MKTPSKRAIVWKIFSSVALISLGQCSQKKADDSGHGGRSPPDGGETVALPSDWDGLTDYAGSPFVISDLK